MKAMCINDEFFSFESLTEAKIHPEFGGVYHVIKEVTSPLYPDKVFYILMEFGFTGWLAEQFVRVDSNIDEMELVNELELKE